MLRFAISVGLVAVAIGGASATVPDVSKTHPQGQEHTPTDREFYAPMPAAPSLSEAAAPRIAKAGKGGDGAGIFSDWLQHFQRPLGLANGTWLVRR